MVIRRDRCTITAARLGAGALSHLFAYIFNNQAVLCMADTWDGLE